MNPIISPNYKEKDAVSTTNAFIEPPKSIYCNQCKYIKLKNHKCRESVFKKTGVVKHVQFCKKHKDNDPYSKAGISMDKIVGIKDRTNISRVYYEVLKCNICHKMPTQIIECPSCSSLFCRDCPSYHKNVQLAKLSNYRPSCSICLYRFSKTNLREETKF